MLKHFLKIKGKKKENTLDAYLYGILKQLYLEDHADVRCDDYTQKEFPSILVWNTIKDPKIGGYYDSTKSIPNSRFRHYLLQFHHENNL